MPAATTAGCASPRRPTGTPSARQGQGRVRRPRSGSGPTAPRFRPTRPPAGPLEGGGQRVDLGGALGAAPQVHAGLHAHGLPTRLAARVVREPTRRRPVGARDGSGVVHRGRVLAARRTTPKELAGGWGAPGWKVAAARTRRRGRPGGRRGARLREIAVAGMLEGESGPRSATPSGSPSRSSPAESGAVEAQHDAVRWLGPDELDEVAWLQPDLPFPGRAAAAAEEEEGLVTLRAVFFEEGRARAVAARLVRGRLRRRGVGRPLAGEDDDEDHPWAVVNRRAGVRPRGPRRRPRGMAGPRHR